LAGCRSKIAPNGFQLGEGGDLEALTLKFSTNVYRMPNVQFSTEPAILPN